MAVPDPIYTAENCNPAYQLFWSLALFWHAPAPDSAAWLAPLKQAVEPDGVRILEHHQRSPKVSQFFLSTKCAVTPAQMMRSLKGRLQYLVRREQPKAFQRNYSLKSVGEVRRQAIEKYVRSQLNHHAMADEKVQQALAAFQVPATGVDLGQVRRSSHGEFIYNLHAVLVHDGRWHEIRPEVLENICGMILRAGARKGHLLSAIGLLSDHIHMTLGCSLAASFMRRSSQTRRARLAACSRRRIINSA
jgi:REP element-mobilizing transposase RayT